MKTVKFSRNLFIIILYLIICDLYFYNNLLVLGGGIVFSQLFYRKVRINYNTLKIINTILLLYIFFLKGNIFSIIQRVKLYNTKLQSQQSTPPHIINKINSILQKRVSRKLKSLIDFGCGNCNTLSQLKFHYKIGIEYDKNIYQNALSEIKYRKYRIDEVINCDIVDYDFENDCIIYMYEPLWNLSDNNSTYMKLFDKLKNTNSDIEIIYITGLLSKALDNNFFRKYNFDIIYKTKIGSIFINRTLFYCKKCKI